MSINASLNMLAEKGSLTTPENFGASFDWETLTHVLGTYLITGEFDLDTVDGIDLTAAQVAEGAPIVLASAEAAGAADDGMCEVDATPGESVISERCDGAIQALQEANVENPREVAIKLGMFEPSTDPHALDSAALQDGTRFVQYEDGSVRVFDPSGKQIAYMDCDGNVVQPYAGPMMNPDPCGLCPEKENEVAGYEPVATPIEVEPAEPGPRVATLKTTIECPDTGECIEGWRNFLIFNSEEEAREFFASDAGKQVLRDMMASGNMGNCVYITDGVGSVQTIEMEAGRDGTLRLRDSLPVLDDDVKTTTYRDDGRRYRHMSETTFEERFLKGDGDPFDAKQEGVPQSTADKGIFVEGGAQDLVYNPETGRYEFNDALSAESRIIYAVIESSGLTVEQYAQMMDMQLPAIFDEPLPSIPSDASEREIKEILEQRAEIIEERARALKAAALREGVTLTDEGAQNLARYLSLGGYQTGGTTVQDAVSHVAQYQVQGIRESVGIK